MSERLSACAGCHDFLAASLKQAATSVLNCKLRRTNIVFWWGLPRSHSAKWNSLDCSTDEHKRSSPCIVHIKFQDLHSKVPTSFMEGPHRCFTGTWAAAQNGIMPAPRATLSPECPPFSAPVLCHLETATSHSALAS